MYSFISIFVSVFSPVFRSSLTSHPLTSHLSPLTVSKTVPLRQGRRGAKLRRGWIKTVPFSVFTFISSPTLIKLKQSPSLIKLKQSPL